MRAQSVFARVWIERPEGWMGRSELRDLVGRLQRIPCEIDSVRIVWDQVTHIDFRGLGDLSAQMRFLTRQGIGVRCTGFSPYLLAILRVALSLDEVEMFETFAGVEASRSPAWTGDLGAPMPDLPSFRPSKN